MIELITELLATDIPLGQTKTDVSAQVCSHVTVDDVDKLRNLVLPSVKIQAWTDKDVTAVMYEKGVNFFSSNELRILFDKDPGGRCQAFLFLHTL